jgi:hypothetical protein
MTLVGAQLSSDGATELDAQRGVVALPSQQFGSALGHRHQSRAPPARF